MLTSKEMIQLANLWLYMYKQTVFRAMYTNHRGQRKIRTFQPISIRYEATEWHPEPCLLLKVVDYDRELAIRDYRLLDLEIDTIVKIKEVANE